MSTVISSKHLKKWTNGKDTIYLATPVDKGDHYWVEYFGDDSACREHRGFRSSTTAWKEIRRLMKKHPRK